MRLFILEQIIGIPNSNPIDKNEQVKGRLKKKKLKVRSLQNHKASINTSIGRGIINCPKIDFFSFSTPRTDFRGGQANSNPFINFFDLSM